MLTMFDKQVQLRMGQANVKRWVDDILPLLTGDGDPLGVDDFATHHLPLDAAPQAYADFQTKKAARSRSSCSLDQACARYSPNRASERRLRWAVSGSSSGLVAESSPIGTSSSCTTVCEPAEPDSFRSKVARPRPSGRARPPG